MKKACILLVVAILLVVSCLALLVGCDEKGRIDYSNRGTVTATIYAYSLEDDGSIVVRFSSSYSSDDDTYSMRCTVIDAYQADGAFYNLQSLTYYADYDTAYELAKDFVESHTEYTLDGADLKIYFDYATLYKSITSDGVRFISGSTYVHSNEITSDSTLVLTIYYRYAYTVAWYAVVAGCALGVLVLLAAVVITLKVIKKRKENMVKE